MIKSEVCNAVVSSPRSLGRINSMPNGKFHFCGGRPLSPEERIIRRWEHEDVLDRHRARMQGAGELMRRRSGIVEHPFGTLMCRAGHRHFLVRGFYRVRGE